MVSPFSQYSHITATLITVSALLTAALIVLGAGSPWVLCYNWALSGILSFVIWNNISRFNLMGGTELKAFGICWPILTNGFQFTYCHFTQDGPFYLIPLQVLALMLVLSLAMSLWQRRHSPFKSIILGLIIGFVSTYIPHAVLWLMLYPIIGFCMRSLTQRNFFSVLTGAVLAIWIVYCFKFLVFSPETANSLLLGYVNILRTESYAIFAHQGLFQYLYLGITLLMVVFYSVSGLLLSAGQSVRADSSIQMLSLVSLAFTLLMILDIQHFFTNLSFYSLFIALHLTIHQSNIRSATHEWWILVFMLINIALCLAPVFFPWL